MGQLTYSLPIINSSAATEDPKVRTALDDIKTWANGNVDATNLAANAVGTSEIADGSVTPVKVGTGSYGAVTFPSQTLGSHVFLRLTSSSAVAAVGMTTGTDRLTVVTAGVYVVTTRVEHGYGSAGPATSRRLSAVIHANSGGGTVHSNSVHTTNVDNVGGFGQTISAVTMIALANVGDYFQAEGYQDSGSNRTVLGDLRAVRVAAL